jgi:hypothetical protein
MLLHGLRMAAMTVLILVCMFLPFLPGSYDGFAVTLSGMAEFFCVTGLVLLVPVGALWLVYEARNRAKRQIAQSSNNKAYYFAIASLVGLSIVGAIVSLSAVFNSGFSIGIGLLALLAYWIARMTVRAKGLKTAETGGFNAAPLYLVVVPIVVALFQFSLMDRAVEFSRNRAIMNCAPLISEIEQYHKANGMYPISLLALWPDYKPSVIGTKQYHYEPNGEAYNVYFEQLSNRFGTREIVMYNKLDQHAFASHAAQILRQFGARSGYYAVNDASSEHWKYFWFD